MERWRTQAWEQQGCAVGGGGVCGVTTGLGWTAVEKASNLKELRRHGEPCKNTAILNLEIRNTDSVLPWVTGYRAVVIEVR